MNRAILLSILIGLSIDGKPLLSQEPPSSGTESTSCTGIKAIAQCPDEGCGPQFDPLLNRRKDLPSDDQDPVLRTIAWMKALANPKHFTAKNRDRTELQTLGEGQKITVVAWALAARKGSQESCNCKLKTKADTDNHIVLVDPSLTNPTLILNEKGDSETVEFTPRVRRNHPNFTQDKLEPLIDPDWSAPQTPTKGKVLVRVTGLLMFDSEHFLNRPLKRFNNWEIHPVLKMEYCPEGETCDPENDSGWVNIESE